jgi:hypothetical protein
VQGLVARSGLSKQDCAENRDLAVSPVDLHVWQGRALSNLDGTDAASRAPRL